MDLDAVLARQPDGRARRRAGPHQRARARATRSAGRTSRSCSTPASTSSPRVNIQHLESLNDVVERITGVKQRETIPDAVVRAADQVELVDMTPEALRRRMAHGNIYAPEKVDAALGNYFRVGNLGALRELALMWVADQVDDVLQDYRERHGIAAPWETRERVVVALTGAPSGEQPHPPGGPHRQPRQGRPPRRARRGRRRPRRRARRELLDAHRQLLDDLGGAYHEVVGADVGQALVAVRPGRARHPARARRQPTGRAGPSCPAGRSSTRSSARRATIDVHVISTSADGSHATRTPLPPVRARLHAAAAAPPGRRRRCSPSSACRS